MEHWSCVRVPDAGASLMKLVAGGVFARADDVVPPAAGLTPPHAVASNTASTTPHQPAFDFLMRQ